MTNISLENSLPAERYIISLLIEVTNYLFIYSLTYGKKKWMTKREMIKSTPATEELSSLWVPIKKPSSILKDI